MPKIDLIEHRRWITDREKIGQAICDAIAGHVVRDAHLALADAVGLQVIAVATDIDNADAIIDDLAAKAKSYVRQNWSFVKSQVPADWTIKKQESQDS